jgi:hypothetical protein
MASFIPGDRDVGSQTTSQQQNVMVMGSPMAFKESRAGLDPIIKRFLTLRIVSFNLRKCEDQIFV